GRVRRAFAAAGAQERTVVPCRLLRGAGGDGRGGRDGARSCAAFAREQFARARRSFAGELPELRVRGLEVDRQVMVAQHFAGARPDGGDDRAGQAVAQLRLQLQFARDLQQVDDLLSGGEQRDVDLAGGEAADVRFERADVL